MEGLLKHIFKNALLKMHKEDRIKISKNKFTKRTRQYRRFRRMRLGRRCPPYSFEALSGMSNVGEDISREQQATQNVQDELVINSQQETAEPTSSLQNTSEDVDIEERGASEPKKPSSLQAQIGTSLSVLGRALTYMVQADKHFDEEVIHLTGEATCLLADLHFSHTEKMALMDLNDNLVGESAEFYTLFKKVEEGLRIFNLTGNLNENEGPVEAGPCTQNFSELGIVEEFKVKMEKEC